VVTAEQRVDLHFAENQADAVGVRSHLESQGVRCVVVPLGDRAYPGVLDKQLPWGVIRVDVDDVKRAKDLLQQWQSAEREDLDQAFDRSEASAPALSSVGPSWGLMVLLGALVFMLAVMMLSQVTGTVLPSLR